MEISDRLSDSDKRIVAALVQLEQDLRGIIAELLAGDFDEEERRAFGMVLATIAAEVTPPVVDVLPPPWGDLQRNSGPA